MAGAPDPDPSVIYRSTDTGPGLHVMLVGISHYPFLEEGEQERQEAQDFGLGQLDSAASTAANVAEWLLKPSVDLAWPVRTIRLVASPSSIEKTTLPLLADRPAATLDNLIQALLGWRLDAAKDCEGAALFYFAGHGVQRTRGGSILLPSDFLQPGRPKLARTVDFSEIYDGMAEPAYPDMAQTQLYFVDACRTDVGGGVQMLANATPPSLWDITEGGVDNRVAPIFFGASVGRPAFGSRTPGEISAFGTDVMYCLNGGAADLFRTSQGAKWQVTIGTLAQAMTRLVGEANKTSGRDRRSFSIDKWTTQLDAPMVTVPAAPQVRCRFSVGPTEAVEHTTVKLKRKNVDLYTLGPPCPPGSEYPVLGGGYNLDATVGPECPTAFAMIEGEIVQLKPPFFDFPMVFTPEPPK